jgi:hypothetical protein
MTLPPTAMLGNAGLAAPRAAAPAGAAAHQRTAAGGLSPGHHSHSDTTLYISLVVLHTKYTGRRDNDFNVYA